MRHSGDSMMTSQTRQPRGILRARRGGATTAGLTSFGLELAAVGWHTESEARGVDGNVDDSWGPAATTASS
jgi:hypothetical protein